MRCAANLIIIYFLLSVRAFEIKPSYETEYIFNAEPQHPSFKHYVSKAQLQLQSLSYEQQPHNYVQQPQNQRDQLQQQQPQQAIYTYTTSSRNNLPQNKFGQQIFTPKMSQQLPYAPRQEQKQQFEKQQHVAVESLPSNQQFYQQVQPTLQQPQRQHEYQQQLQQQQHPQEWLPQPQYVQRLQQEQQQQQQQQQQHLLLPATGNNNQQQYLQPQTFQRQQFNAVPPQQLLPQRRQQIQHIRPQTTTTASTSATQQNQQQPPWSQQQAYQQQQPQRSQTTQANSAAASGSTYSAFLPAYLDEDDSPGNFTLPCAVCCNMLEDPCKRCCDTPFLSATVLKSSAG